MALTILKVQAVVLLSPVAILWQHGGNTAAVTLRNRRRDSG
jgi:hypothetical protein